MEKQYVYANIKLPILVNEDDSLEPMVEYLTMEFEPCGELPPKPDKTIDYSMILENLKDIISEKSNGNIIEDNTNTQDVGLITEPSSYELTDQKLYIQPNEILHRKKKKTNMSLKNFRQKKHNFTSANREDVIISMLDTVVGSLQQPMAEEQLEVTDL